MKNLFLKTVLSFLLLSISSLAFSQADSSIVEVTGMVYTGQNAQLVPVPFVTVSIKGTTRGTYANLNGMFTIVVKKGQMLVFSAIGFKTVEKEIPPTIMGNPRTTMMVALEETSINLPEAVIFPWPSREHLRLEFLAMKPGQAFAMEEVAKKNLEETKMAALARNSKADGNEGADFYLRQQAASYYTYGQRPATPIFDPLAWAKFYKAIQNGDFKKKYPKDDDK